MIASRRSFGSLCGLVIGMVIFSAPLGCKPMDSATAPVDYADEYGGEYGGYAGEGMVATGSTLSAERSFAEDSRSSGDEFKKMAPPMEPAAPEPEPEEGQSDRQTSQSGPPDDDKKPEPEHGRQMVYTASMQLAVYELDEAIEFAEDIPTRYGGWVQNRNDFQITLRVPAARLGEIMTELATLGLVLGKTLQAADVTAEYTDLESRIAVLEKMVGQLEILLAQAKTVEDSLKVRQELERVRIELEAAKTRFRQLAELVGFSTLSIYLSQRGSDQALPTSNDPFPWVDQLGVESTEFR